MVAHKAPSPSKRVDIFRSSFIFRSICEAVREAEKPGKPHKEKSACPIRSKLSARVGHETLSGALLRVFPPGRRFSTKDNRPEQTGAFRATGDPCDLPLGLSRRDSAEQKRPAGRRW